MVSSETETNGTERHLPRSTSMDAASTLERLLSTRASCRAFTPEPVPEHTIRRILQNSQLTASWCNSQPWRVAVTRGAGTERLRDALYIAASTGATEVTDIPFPREYRGVHLDRRRECGSQLYNAVGIERTDHARRQQQALRNFEFFGAPHVAVIHTDEALGPYGAVDCGAYVTNFLTSAAAHGVGTVAQAALAMHSDVLRRELDLGEDRTIVCGVSFGYPDVEHRANSYRTSRAPIDEVVDWIDN